MPKAELIVRKSRWISVSLFTGSSIGVGAGIYWVINSEPNWVSLVAVLFFGASSLAFLWQLFDAKPRLVISENGICVTYWNVGRIAWRDIREVFVRTDGGADYICFTLRSPEDFRSRMSSIARTINTATQQTEFGDFTLKPSSMGLDTREVLAIVREHMRSSIKPEQPKFGPAATPLPSSDEIPPRAPNPSE